jgi:bla regulator protein blaR1
MIRCASLALLFLACGFAQQTAALTFEVASVKPANPDAKGSSIRFMPGGGLNMTNMPLLNMITFAYDVRDFQVSGGPGWVGTERFDVTARPDRAAADALQDLSKMTDDQQKTVREQMNERVRNLLADRFQLVVHKETKDQQIYALVVSKNGAKFQEAKELGPRRGISMNGGRIQAFGAPLEMLTQSLSGQLGRPVVDKTGLTAKYDFVLEWTPDLGAAGDAAPVGPTIFTALQEQLGLRLESQKGPVPNIVIDRVEKPSQN